MKIFRNDLISPTCFHKKTDHGSLHFLQRPPARPEDIDPFTDELADICRSAGWEYHLLDDAERNS